MTTKELVLSIYPKSKLIRWKFNQTAISIGTKEQPYLTLGWDFNNSENEESTWDNAWKNIQIDMLRKLEQ